MNLLAQNFAAVGLSGRCHTPDFKSDNEKQLIIEIENGLLHSRKLHKDVELLAAKIAKEIEADDAASINEKTLEFGQWVIVTGYYHEKVRTDESLDRYMVWDFNEPRKGIYTGFEHYNMTNKPDHPHKGCPAVACVVFPRTEMYSKTHYYIPWDAITLIDDTCSTGKADLGRLKR